MAPAASVMAARKRIEPAVECATWPHGASPEDPSSAAAGTLVGTIGDLYNVGVDGQFLEDIGEVLKPGRYAVVSEIDFAGSVNNGMVDLNALGGTLSDPGGIISSSIDANLGGVFTGINAEAFVGGFDLIDELNQFNHVDGIYTIER